MRTLLAATLLAALASVPLSAQKLNLDFRALAAKAKAANEVTLDGDALQTLKQSFPGAGEKGKAADIAKMFSEIQAVEVRNYEFTNAGEYSDRDLEPLHQQVGSGSGWSRIINVKEPNESTEIYLYNSSGKTLGLLIISAEAKELSVVHISGSVQLAQLKDVVNSTIQYHGAAANAPDSKQ